MATERLSNLAVIAMYGDRSVVCGKFVALHPTRMTAASLLLGQTYVEQLKISLRVIW